MVFTIYGDLNGIKYQNLTYHIIIHRLSCSRHHLARFSAKVCGLYVCVSNALRVGTRMAETFSSSFRFLSISCSPPIALVPTSHHLRPPRSQHVEFSDTRPTSAAVRLHLCPCPSRPTSPLLSSPLLLPLFLLPAAQSPMDCHDMITLICVCSLPDVVLPVQSVLRSSPSVHAEGLDACAPSRFALIAHAGACCSRPCSSCSGTS